jgi:hypothetical protein
MLNKNLKENLHRPHISNSSIKQTVTEYDIGLNNNDNINNIPISGNVSPSYLRDQTYTKTDFNKNFDIKQGLTLNSYEQIKFLLNQFDMYLQLLIQNILLTDDNKLKIRCYNLLFTFVTTKNNIQKYYNLPGNKIKFNFLKVLST